MKLPPRHPPPSKNPIAQHLLNKPIINNDRRNLPKFFHMPLAQKSTAILRIWPPSNRIAAVADGAWFLEIAAGSEGGGDGR